MKNDPMMVKIYAPFKVYYNGAADSLSASNDTGPFDILPNHKNFMSLVKRGDVMVRQRDKPDFKITIDRGVLHVRSNKVTLFLDI